MPDLETEIYKEVGTNYRFFLAWRHATFAGNFIVLGAVLSLCTTAFKESREIAWIIPLCASPVGILLWIIDMRTRQLFQGAVKAGKLIESSTKGYYTIAAEDIMPKPRKFWMANLTQSFALTLSFVGTSLVLLLMSALLFHLRSAISLSETTAMPLVVNPPALAHPSTAEQQPSHDTATSASKQNLKSAPSVPLPSTAPNISPKQTN